MKFKKQYWAFIIMGIAIVLFALSFISADYAHTMDRETKRIEKNLHERQSIMESYAL